MILIATDEAGYGPKLGPLVVAATAWQIPEPMEGEPADAFANIRGPVTVEKRKVVVDDSKAVFQPKSSSGTGYGILEMVSLAACRWLGKSPPAPVPCAAFASEDLGSLAGTPWLSTFAAESVEASGVDELLDHWKAGPVRLIDAEARVLSAGAFNRLCDAGRNKSDVLSETTLGLVRKLLDRIDVDDQETVAVYCDRHGGRRYYAGPLQMAFDDSLVQVVAESKTESRYVVPYGRHPFSIRFTVKGDSFTPVAFSSMVAKYLREKAMESLNAYFSERHQGDSNLEATAGYPVDADRFLEDIRPIIDSDGIDRDQLIRKR